jgi:hypothetical protein
MHACFGPAVRHQIAAVPHAWELNFSGDSGDALYQSGPAMPESDSTQPRPLPDALERALHDASGRTLQSLSVLRRALRQHVRSERSHGVTLTELELELRALVTRSDRRSNDASGNAGADRSLSDQVVKWGEMYFMQAD